MASQKEISQDINELSLLKSLTKIYGEIASLKMKKTRQEVFNSRQFLAEVGEVFQIVILSYKKEVEKLIRESGAVRGQRVTLLAHNGKEVAVLLSSNTGLYGEVIQTNFDLFLQNTAKSNVEITIVGKTGRRMFESSSTKPFTYFELKDGEINSNKASEIIKHLVQYEIINVYYGQFRNIISQKPSIFSISAESFMTNTPESKRKESYIFEPNLKSILQFFETEIFASLFDQTLREHELAKFGSRILAMDTAESNINDRLKSLGRIMLKVKHREGNRKQLDSLVSSSLW